MKTGNVLIGAVKKSFKPGDKVTIAKAKQHYGGKTGKILRSIYPGQELVKTRRGMFYLSPDDLTLKS
jgi:hypothetical protein